MEMAAVDVNAYQDQLRQTQKRLADNESDEKKLTNDDNKIQQILTQIDEAQKKLTEMTPEMERMKQEMEKINAAIMDVGGSSYKSLKD